MLNWLDRFAHPPSGPELQLPQVKAEGADSGRMPIIVVASQKGGCGKTTIAAHLAIEARRMGHEAVVLVDADWQGSLSRWWQAREDDTLSLATLNPSEPGALRPEDLAASITERGKLGSALAIIDTPPARTAAIEQIIAIADLVLIPARPSPHDLHAVGATVDMARRRGKPFFFVINGAVPRSTITVQAIAALSDHGPVSPVILYQRVAYAASMIDGHTVLESAASKKAAKEISELWKHVISRLNKSQPTTRSLNVIDAAKGAAAAVQPVA